MIRTVQSPVGMVAVVNQLSAIPPDQFPVEVKWGKPRRTNAQNRYLWGVVYATLADALTERTGELVTTKKVHAGCKENFAPRIKIPGFDEPVPMSTTELCRSGEEESFQMYVMQIQEMAARMDVYIPDPGES